MSPFAPLWDDPYADPNAVAAPWQMEPQGDLPPDFQLPDDEHTRRDAFMKLLDEISSAQAAQRQPEGFLDRFAMNLHSNPIQSSRRPNNAAQAFLSGFVPRATQGFAESRIKSRGLGPPDLAGRMEMLKLAGQGSEQESRDNTTKLTRAVQMAGVRQRMAPKAVPGSPEWQAQYDAETGAGIGRDRQRIASGVEKDPNKAGDDPIDYSPDAATTISGKQYINLDAYKGKERGAAQEWARKNGVPGVSASEDDALKQIDTARLNLTRMLDDLKETLPKDAAGRIVSIPAIKLSQFLKSNAKRGAVGTWRTAAIQAMRAAAGSKGLRINQAEILMSAANDLTQLDDPLPVALKRLQNMMKQFDDSEGSTLTRDRSTLPARLGVPELSPAVSDSARALRMHGVSRSRSTSHADAAGFK